MKISNWAGYFILVLLPLLWVIQLKAQDTNTYSNLNIRYDGAMTVAAHDAITSLRLNAKPNYEYGYVSNKFSRINKEPAYETFMRTLSLNFQSETDIAKDVLAGYVPVFAILEYDGFSMNVYQEYNNGSEKVLDRVWLPKIPFVYTDRIGNIVHFSLDEYVNVYDVALQEWVNGNRKEVIKEVNIDLLNDEVLFDQVRRDTIVNTMQDNFAYRINEHNVYSKQLGITYTFTMPLIPQEDWYNTVDDVSIFAFLQGYPLERGKGTYNQFAFTGSRLIKQDSILATTTNGKKQYYAESCGFNYPVEEVFSSKKAAAKAGYFELSCMNQ